MKKRNIFISGASRGIGESMAKHFAKSNLELEYVELADTHSMKVVEAWSEHPEVRIFMAAYCEGIRLIDNTTLY